MPLKIGILIIGSLFWDLDKNRPGWRADRLDMAGAQNVFALFATAGCRNLGATATRWCFLEDVSVVTQKWYLASTPSRRYLI